MLNNPEAGGQEGGEGGANPAGGPPAGMEDSTIQVTPEEKQAIDRVSSLVIIIVECHIQGNTFNTIILNESLSGHMDWIVEWIILL